MEEPPIGGKSADFVCLRFVLFCFFSEMLVVNISFGFYLPRENALRTTHLLFLFFNNTVKDPLSAVICKPYQAKDRVLQKLIIILTEYVKYSKQ